jgi:hypothetical protein
MTEQKRTSGSWNPRPFEGWGDTLRSDYYAGYSDGYHGAHFGAGHDGSRSQDSYRQGFNDGRGDAAPSKAEGRS